MEKSEEEKPNTFHKVTVIIFCTAVSWAVLIVAVIALRRWLGLQ